MVAKDLLSSLEVVLITNYADLWISVQKLAEAIIVIAVSENIQGDPAFTLIIGKLDVRSVKE